MTIKVIESNGQPSYYSIKMMKTGVLDLELLNRRSGISDGGREVNEIVQGLEIILKDGLGSHLMCFGRSPSTFYFTGEQNRNILNECWNRIQVSFSLVYIISWQLDWARLIFSSSICFLL